jgi:hypothetical protein
MLGYCHGECFPYQGDAMGSAPICLVNDGMRFVFHWSEVGKSSSYLSLLSTL